MEQANELAPYIRDIPDFPRPGILFKDITPLLAEPSAFQRAIDLLTEHYRPQAIDAVAAAEARGFLFAAPLALELKKPLVPLRKPGRLPAGPEGRRAGSRLCLPAGAGVPQGTRPFARLRGVQPSPVPLTVLSYRPRTEERAR